ncbi:MAG: response regulator [Candidatus Aureabacteria bacterium]|nr:response regulator [Candidatus Auribacterota bacterium]
MDFSEKRKTIRFHFYYHIQHRLKGTDQWFHAYTDNVSLGGIVFISAKSYEIGQELEMKLQSPKLEDIPFTLNGKVKWRKNQKDIFIFGIEFSPLFRDQSHYLEKVFTQYMNLKIEKKQELEGQGKKILIVEDDKPLADLISFRLQDFYYDVYHALDGTSALSLCHEIKPHVMLLDVNLPDILGTEIADTLRSKDARLPRIIVITGMAYSTDTIKQKWTEEFGAADFITKPFDFEELLKKIKKIVSGME